MQWGGHQLEGEREEHQKRLSYISGQESEGEQLDMGTGSEMVTGQTNMDIPGLMC